MTDYRELSGVSDLSDEASGGDGVKVAVIDTGIPAIKDILVCLSENLTCGSGKDSGHATFIGSLLFGRGPVKGICLNATACFIKVFENNVVRPDTVARAIIHAVENWHVDIINLSLGFSRYSPCPDILKKACDKAHKAGVVLVASAGNDGGKVLWPAALRSTICVGSTDGQDKESFSNYGEVDFVINGKDLEGQDVDGKIVTKSGTSFSTALITGMLALIIARRRRKGLDLSISSIKQELVDQCSDVGKPGWDENTGYGIPFIKSHKNKLTSILPRLINNLIFDKISMLVKKVTSALMRRKNNNE